MVDRDTDTDAYELAELSSSPNVDSSTRTRASRSPVAAQSLPATVDVADRISGLYRILDLMSEESAGGVGEPQSPDSDLRSRS